VTSNGILFTGDALGGIGIFQFSKGNLQVCRSPDQIPDHNNEITCMVTSFDNEYLFTADKDGLLVKWHIKIPIARVSNDLRIENGIWSMCVTKNSKFLVTGGLGEINVLSIYPKKILMNLQRVQLAGVGRISMLEMTSDDQNT
jgi:WD40 repeat protein